MAISGVSSAVSAANTTSSVTNNNTVDETQTRFMTLLIAQMKNQDPLNPMDNSQMTSQISQLNMVSGINKLNTTLAAMAGDVQNGESIKAAALLGHDVLVPGSHLQLSQGKAEMGMELAQPADDVKVTIRDSSGNVVHTMDLGPQEAGVQSLVWDGVTDSGTAAADGSYKFGIEALRDGEKLKPTLLSFGKVDNLSLSGGLAKLNVPNLGDFALTDIREIR
jgi:flagellar basal-body rod modification protein FlgD